MGINGCFYIRFGPEPVLPHESLTLTRTNLGSEEEMTDPLSYGNTGNTGSNNLMNTNSPLPHDTTTNRSGYGNNNNNNRSAVELEEFVSFVSSRSYVKLGRSYTAFLVYTCLV